MTYEETALLSNKGDYDTKMQEIVSDNTKPEHLNENPDKATVWRENHVKTT